MAAETGSGKTGAFCLPVLQITWESLKDLQKGNNKQKSSSTSGGGVPSGEASFFFRLSEQSEPQPLNVLS